MPPRWPCACAPARAVDRGVAEHCRPFDPRPHAQDWPAPPQSDHQDGFSSAMRTINSSTSLSIRGRPGVRRARDPSNLRATSLRYHAKMAVSYTHLRAHETDSYLVCRLMLEKKNK